MNRVSSRVWTPVLTLVVATVVALVAVLVERRGPELVVYGNVCGPTASDLCYRPVLKGGFPVAYLFDAPGVSVEDQLAFVEDHFRPVAFVLDVAFYFAIIALGPRIAARLRNRRQNFVNPRL